MERNWEYVQERIDLIQQMNDGIKGPNPNPNQKPVVYNPYSIDPGVVEPSGPRIPSSQRPNYHDPVQMTLNPVVSNMSQRKPLPLSEDISRILLDPGTMPNQSIFKQPTVYDETGVCTGDSCPMPKLVNKQAIIWVGGNDQVSFTKMDSPF